MEFPSEVVGGLQLAGDPLRLPDKCYTKLLELVFKGAIGETQRHKVEEGLNSIHGGDIAAMKQVYACLLTLALEAARQDVDSSTLSSTLEDSKMSADRISSFLKIYQEYKDKLQIHLSSYGSQFPHIVDVNWRLDYCVKGRHLEKINESKYLISLDTEKSGHLETEKFQFSCTVEQLQDLVGKLKDSVKCLERHGQK